MITRLRADCRVAAVPYLRAIRAPGERQIPDTTPETVLSFHKRGPREHHLPNGAPSPLWGGGSGVLAKLLPNLTTPTPNPSPQGHKGGEDGVRCSFCAFRRDPAIRRCQSSAKFPTKPALTASLPMPHTIRNGRRYALAQGPARGDVASSRGLDGRSTMGGDAT